jgi:hypothetical protein
MTAVIAQTFHSSLASSVYEEIQNRTSLYHYFAGKILEWSDETLPPTPLTNGSYENDVRNNIVLTKQVQLNDVSLSVRRINWVLNTAYDMYDDDISTDNPGVTGAESLEDANFYVLNSEYRIYKCIFNNSGEESTIEPTGTSTSYIETEDGYVWKFMGTLPLSLQNKFLTSAFMPVTKSVKNQYYSGGSIIGYNILDGGSDYVDGEAYAVVNGDGTGGYSNQFYDTEYNVTVSSGINDFGFGNKFYINNTLNKSLQIFENVNYIFDVSDSSNTGHILKFSSTENGTHNGGTEITTGITRSGTPGNNNAKVYVNIPETNSNSIIYYYDETDSGVGGLINISENIPQNQPQIDLIIEASVITALRILDPGYGYTDAQLVVETGPSDTGSGANITLNLSSGDLNTQQANVELLATPGALSWINIDNAGSGYTNPVVTITGDGTGAEATASLNANGEIESILITNYGSGYSYANVEVTGGAGTSAVLRAIMSPKGGHGSNMPNELCANIVSFYGAFEQEEIDGFEISNDYRQIGIIKDIAEYGELIKRYNDNVGTSLWKLEGIIDPANFPIDSEISNTFATKVLKVAAVKTNEMLVQSLNGSVPTIADTYQLNGNSFSVTSVTNPTINKFSGEMLYIDNKLAFTPSDEQFVVVRSFIRF